MIMDVTQSRGTTNHQPEDSRNWFKVAYECILQKEAHRVYAPILYSL